MLHPRLPFFSPMLAFPTDPTKRPIWFLKAIYHIRPHGDTSNTTLTTVHATITRPDKDLLPVCKETYVLKRTAPMQGDLVTWNEKVRGRVLQCIGRSSREVFLHSSGKSFIAKLEVQQQDIEIMSPLKLYLYRRGMRLNSFRTARL